jgi:hypothetical protein
MSVCRTLLDGPLPPALVASSLLPLRSSFSTSPESVINADSTLCWLGVTDTPGASLRSYRIQLTRQQPRSFISTSHAALVGESLVHAVPVAWSDDSATTVATESLLSWVHHGAS